MIKQARKAYNNSYSNSAYSQFLQYIQQQFGNTLLPFKVAETPVFISQQVQKKAIDTCEAIIKLIQQPNFLQLTQAAIPPQLQVPNEGKHPHFMVFDFGICEDEQGQLEPKLIEMQGFPSLFAFQTLLDDAYRKFFEVPAHYTAYLSGYNFDKYIHHLKQIILGDKLPQNVVLLEIQPTQQKTYIDFYLTQKLLGIKPICVTEVIQEGENLFYILNGVKTPIYRIYNRVIFDELLQQPIEIQQKAKFFFNTINAQFVTHPNWFYRLSKFVLPLIQHQGVPTTFYLQSVLHNLPSDLENYVLKPLFSFAGQGVMIDVTLKDIEAIKNPEQWILQKKVQYASFIPTPTEPAKAELRIFYFWDNENTSPVAVGNLARISKGKMIGVSHNAHKDWVGGSAAYFE